MLFCKKYEWDSVFLSCTTHLTCLYLKENIILFFLFNNVNLDFEFSCSFQIFFSFQIGFCIFLAQWLSCCCWATKFHNYHLGIGSRHFQSRNVLERKTFSFHFYSQKQGRPYIYKKSTQHITTYTKTRTFLIN